MTVAKHTGIVAASTNDMLSGMRTASVVGIARCVWNVLILAERNITRSPGLKGEVELGLTRRMILDPSKPN